MNPARVVITGFGAISPLGLTANDTWAGLCAGRCGISKITSFDPAGFACQIAGRVPDYRIQDYVPKNYRKAAKLMCRDIELAVIAANEAIVHSSLVTKGTDPENVNINPERFAINIGAGFISCDLVELAPAAAASVTGGEFDIQKWGSHGIELVPPLWLLKYLPNMLACHISIIHDIQGPSNSITCGEAGAAIAIIEAAQVIQRGGSDIALAGGAETKANPMNVTRQCLLKRATTENNHDPVSACRPFDADARGSVFGEGSGIVILENLDNAEKRDAKIYAEFVGAGQSNSINPAYEHLEPDGKGIQIAIEKALAEAQIEPEQLDLIIPHGTGIPQDDLAESKAIEIALGKAGTKVAVWPTKSMLSNTGAACGALDAVAAIFAINEGKIPAARNFDRKTIGCNLNIVKEPIKKEIRYALCCSYTFGGQTTAIVLKNPN